MSLIIDILARQILDSDEPEVRSYQMLRHLFGAYEPLDEALSVLRVPGLVIRRRRGLPGHTTQHDYYLTEHGRETARRIVQDVPELAYYAERSRLVAERPRVQQPTSWNQGVWRRKRAGRRHPGPAARHPLSAGP